MILDTNALSALADGDSVLKPVVDRAPKIAIPVIVLGEYLYGIRQSRHRSRYERWLAGLIGDCRVLDVDKGTTEFYAELRAGLRRSGQPIPGNDIWIAALARQHSLPIISRDLHFDAVPGLRRVSW